ncbi:EpsG family protein [Bacillus sp. B3-WWTP-C-10-D-3]|uniref:EpsG family protein n=1 Tax=Bacillus sp. B3-WWTP-C-10-D-3 TaxID=2653217 RepID=UPI001261B2E8|nr:EpsG family protein [Bacillus sp. B3-WWTP-C-10-D-3]KAB7640216.1 EpsG family protein [Bacillus sp. B3-WWTP-C-10-D-3]
MLIYNLNLCLIIMVFFYGKIKKSILGTEKSKFSDVLIFLSLWLVSGFRYMVGTDFNAYNLYFENLGSYNLKYPYYEKGYYVLNYVIKLLMDNSQYIFLATSFITIFLITKTLKDYSNSYILSVFLFVTMYFYYNSFNLVRQYLVVAILFYAIKYILNKSFKKYLLVITIASFFHITALAMIPFYWILRKKFSNLMYLFMLAVSVCLSLFTTNIVNLVASIFGKFSVYNNYLVEGSSTKSIILITSAIILFSLINKNKLSRINENSIIYINGVYFALVFSVIAIGNILFFRVAIYFYIYSLLLIPLFLAAIDKKLRPVIYTLIFMILTAYHYYLLFNNNAGVFPYDYNVNISTDSGQLPLITIAVIVVLLFVICLKYNRSLNKKQIKTKQHIISLNKSKTQL